MRTQPSLGQRSTYISLRNIKMRRKKSMLTFFRALYIVFVAGMEIAVAFLFMPSLGAVATVTIEIALFAVLMMIYAVIFRQWRPSLDFLLFPWF
jgi:cell division septal protein FtsQ